MKVLGHVNYTDPSLSREHFEFAGRLRAWGRGELGRACIYVSKERPGSV